MRKHFLILMLLALLPLAGFAQFQVNNYVRSGNYIYQILTASDGVTPGTVKLIGIVDGKNPVGDDKVLNLKGKITISLDDEYSVDFYVNDAADDAIKKTYSWNGFATAPTEVGDFAGRVEAKSVVIPKEFLKVKKDFFYGYTNMKAISFEENSEVKEIESGAFNTTQITTFDFSNCSKLTTLKSGVFVQEGTAVNSYVETITLPLNSEALTSIGTAFQRLTNLTAINNLENSKITTVVADAFKGDAKLEKLALPSTVKTIAANAFRGSGIEDLTIDVTSLNDATPGNVYGSADKSTLRKLTLTGVLAGQFKSQAFLGCDELATVDMTGMTINGGKIGDNAFENCVRITSLAFNDITEGTIGNSAFKGCIRLETVTFQNITGTDAPHALIDDNAFAGCLKLGTINFGNLTHVTIGASAFALAATPTAAATALTFGDLTDVDINASAFAGFTKMNKIEFGKTDDVNIASLAFANCTSGLAAKATATLEFKTSMKDVTIAGTAEVDGAFYNTTKLSSIKFAEPDNLNIQTYAFNKAASTGEAATVEFGDAVNLQIAANAFKGASKVKSIEFGDIEDDATATDEIAANAFDVKYLETLKFGNLNNVQIKNKAFENATSSLGTDVWATAEFGNLENGSLIEDGAFTGASKLNKVTIGDITDSYIGSAGTDPVFPAVKTVTIGAVKSTNDATLILAKAFAYSDVTGTTLSLADNKALENAAASFTNKTIANGAFDFTAVKNTGAAENFEFPVVTIGELKTANVFTAGALKGNTIDAIVFDGNIAAGALDVIIIEDEDTPTAGVSQLKLATLTFNGEIATGGIVTNAFAEFPTVMTITFNGKMAATAVAADAFKKLKANSTVTYAYDGTDIDLTVNPFAKSAFNGTYLTTRDIAFSVVNPDLEAKFWDSENGLGSDVAGSTAHVFDIYRVIYQKPVVPDLSFKVYPDIKTSRQHTTTSPRTAWARWELGYRVDANVTGTLTSGQSLVIKRVQKVDGTNDAKITIYGTYTDEDDALKASTVYMVPLKVTNGYYHISGANKTTLIVKVENNGADFEDDFYKVKVNQTGYDAYNAANNSIWDGLENKELYVASNIMTNQQLIDKQAVDAAATDASGVYGYYHAQNNIDIYRGTYGTTNQKVVENLYIMADPSKNTGFRIDMNPITDQNDAYINKGWYYMLLKKYDNATAARVIWMDDATESDVTAILSAKSDAKNVVNSNAIYTLQGVRVSQMQKGQIYIVNGKKYLAK